MNIDEVRQSYLAAGFSWTPHLNSLFQVYGGKKFVYNHPRSGNPKEAFFYEGCHPRLNSGTGFIAMTSKKLGEEVAPVGECNNRNIDLLLSVSGRLVAYAHDTMFCWSFDPPPNWRQSVENILQSQPPQFVAHLDDDEDDEGQAD